MPINSTIFYQSLKNSNISSSGLIIGREIYESIDISATLTNKELENITPFTEDVISRQISELINETFFVNLASKYLRRELISLFPTWKYCIGKVQHISIDAQEVNLFFPIPKLDINVEIILVDLSEKEFKELQTINNQEYYLINYCVRDVLSPLKSLGKVTIFASYPTNITPIKSLGFDINDKERHHSINKNSIIQEEV